MFLFNYYSDAKKGMLKAGITKEETRKLIKSNYDYYKKDNDRSESDYFISVGIISYYNNEEKLEDIEIVEDNCIFMYENINLFGKYLKIRQKLNDKNILLSIEKDSEVMTIENEKLCLYIPDLMEELEHPNIEDATVKSILIDLSLGCSVSFERLISNHIPSKTSYLGSKTSSDDGPAVRMSYDHQKYFATHGKSKLAKQYREWQKKVVQNGKIMEAIKKDSDDIKSKTGTTYLRPLVDLKNFARTLDPKNFIIK